MMAGNLSIEQRNSIYCIPTFGPPCIYIRIYITSRGASVNLVVEKK